VGGCGRDTEGSVGVGAVGSGCVVLWSLKHGSEQLESISIVSGRSEVLRHTMEARRLDICISLARRCRRRRGWKTWLSRRCDMWHNAILMLRARSNTDQLKSRRIMSKMTFRALERKDPSSPPVVPKR
jgi:hypothetical protein